MHMDASTAIAAPIEVYTLTDTFVSAYDPFYAIAGLEVRTVGTIYKRSNYSYNQIGISTDWVFPRDNFPANASLYQARCSLTGYSNVKPGSETFGSWVVLSSDIEWAVDMYRLDADAGSFKLDIRFGDGSDPINSASSVTDSAPCLVSNDYSFVIEAN